MTESICLRCGRVGLLTDWPLGREVRGFGAYAVALQGWRCCTRCLAEVTEMIDQLEDRR